MIQMIQKMTSEDSRTEKATGGVSQGLDYLLGM
jgi:hypothetical protein